MMKKKKMKPGRAKRQKKRSCNSIFAVFTTKAVYFSFFIDADGLIDDDEQKKKTLLQTDGRPAYPNPKKQKADHGNV